MIIYLYGASGHGKVIADILQLAGNEQIAFIDDADKGGSYSGYPCYFPAHIQPGKTLSMIVSIGNNQTRALVAKKLQVDFVNAIHPRSVVAGDLVYGHGNAIMAGSMINPGTRIGNHCIVNTGAVIDHECQLGDFVHISPNATLCGQVVVEPFAWVGAGAVVLPGLKIGENSIVGAGAVVTKNVPPDTVVMGNPARKK